MGCLDTAVDDCFADDSDRRGVVVAGVLDVGVDMSQDEAGRIARATERLRRTRGGVMKVALPTAAALGAGAAVALGSIPGGGGTFTGCYVTTDPPARCRTFELRRDAAD